MANLLDALGVIILVLGGMGTLGGLLVGWLVLPPPAWPYYLYALGLALAVIVQAVILFALARLLRATEDKP